MGFLDHVRLWEDVLDPRLDEKAAPSLGGVHLGREERVYSDPVEFFRRTLITSQMVNALENVADALSGRGGNKLLMLLSLFGGGKTHTLLTIYHAFRSPAALLEAKAEDEDTRERVRKLVEELRRAKVGIVVIDGYFGELAPTPVNPLEVPGGYRVQTIWGSIAHQLGRFGEVRENDRRLLAPPADVLARLLGDEPVLILVDELADYAVRLRASGEASLRNYADQVLSFVESLAKAVDLSRKAVLIVSLPAEERGEGLEVEERYKTSQDVVTSIHKSIGKVASKKIVPVAPRDIPNILKVRIFEEVDERVAKVLASTLTRTYSDKENAKIFGEDAVRRAHGVERTYPFHPSYIETLVDVVDKHEGLEKTRDAIRITRKVVRRLANAGDRADLVMPYHIDVEDRDIGATLLAHEMYRQYATVADEDIVKRVRGYEKPELAKIIAKTILVRTFVYAGLLRYRQAYPDKHEVIFSSFDPSTSRALRAQPKDYVDALEWAANNLVYLMSEGGRYWFTQVASPIRRVEMTARTVDDYEALKKIQDYAQKLLSIPYEAVVSGTWKKKGKRSAGKTPFDVSSSKVMSEPEPVDHDSRDYILLAVLSQSPLKGDSIRRIIYETPGGGLRRHPNTVYLIYPGDANSISQMLGFAKLLIACEMVHGELEAIYEDKDIRKVMREKLEKYWRGLDGVEGRLVINILAGLNTVAYPWFDEREHRNTFKVTRASMADTIIETAARALKAVKPQKLYEELDFEQLDYMLSQAGTELSEGDAEKPVSDIVDYFYSNPRLPMAAKDVVEGALIDGVRRLMIGVKRAGRVYFKKVHECRGKESCAPPSVEEGEAPARLEPSDLVLPWRVALQEQLDGLKEVREERVPGGIRRVWHAFYVDGSLLRVAEALESMDLDALRYSPLVRVVEFMEEGIDVKLDKYEVTASPGEDVDINVVIERVGEFRGDVSLSASRGTLSVEKISIGDEEPSAVVEWRVRAPEGPGTHRYEVRATSPSGEILRTASVTLVVVGRRGTEVFKGAPPKGAKLSMIGIEVNKFNFKPLRVLDLRFGAQCEVEEAALELEATFADRTSKVSLRLSDASLDDVKSIFPAIAQRFGISVSRMRYEIRLRPRGREYIEAPELSEAEARDIESYTTYRVYEEGREGAE